jgi:hypothetical protein
MPQSGTVESDCGIGDFKGLTATEGQTLANGSLN